MSQNKTLKYIAKYQKSNDSISVDLQRIDSSHPFFKIDGTLNVVKIETDIYSGDNAMILMGPGAGTFETASGVFSDLVKMVPR